MADSPELEKFLEQARRRLALVRDKDILDEALKKMQGDFAAWQRREQKFIRELPMGKTARHPEVINELAHIRRDFYDNAEFIVGQAEEKQKQRINKGRDLNPNFRIAARRRAKEKDRDDGRGR